MNVGNGVEVCGGYITYIFIHQMMMQMTMMVVVVLHGFRSQATVDIYGTRSTTSPALIELRPPTRTLNFLYAHVVFVVVSV